MELFDKKFVYLEWDDVLEGKEVFFADTLPELRRRVECNNPNFRYTVKKHDGDYPFTSDDDIVFYAMVYYDPFYDIKLAWKNGEQIQARPIKSTVHWLDWYNDDWMPDCYEYRVKPERTERRMTNRELAKWLADNNGQAMYTSSGFKGTEHSYITNDDDPVSSTVRIRGWDETEWHEPEVEELLEGN